MRILLVEDDPGVGRFVSRGLAAEGHVVEWLRTGGAARARLRDESFAVAVIDLGLPDMDGLDLCRALRDGGVDVPICILTARAALEDKLEGFASGADDYLAKPFAFEELLVRLNAIVRRRDAAAAGERIAIGPLEIDVRARRATAGGADIPFSRREFDVLLSLAREAGQPVSRERIRAIAWGGDSAVTDNAVDVYIGYVRRRLAQHPGAPTIRTARGRGFVLDGG